MHANPLLLAIALLATAFASNPPDTSAPMPAPSTTAAPSVRPSLPAWVDGRLASLTPDKPWAYFELGEELAERGDDPVMRTLARTLFVLAYETSKSASESRAVGAGADIRVSVCLALAALSEREHERTWLQAVAASLGWQSPRPTGERRGNQAAVDPAALDLCNAIGLIRIGEGRQAARLLDKPEVAQLLLRTERLLSPGGLSGGEARIRRLMAEWPNCSECRNRRFIKNADGVRLCPKCGGRPGPSLVQQELMYQLRLESSLLHGVQKSWVAQTIVDGGAPLRDLDPDELAKTLAVDPTKTIWRNGAWTAPASPKALPAADAPD